MKKLLRGIGARIEAELEGGAPALQAAHWGADKILRSAGFTWEVRRAGDLQLGLWRKKLRETSAASAQAPRRIVFLPGFGDTALSWSLVIALLSPTLKRQYDELVCVDFPGFSGFLARETAFPSMDLLQAAVDDLLDSLKPHTIWGHSLGTWLAGRYAAACGEGTRPLNRNRHGYAGPSLLLLLAPSGVFEGDLEQRAWEEKFKAVQQEGFAVFRPHLFAREPFWAKPLINQGSAFIRRSEIVAFMNSFDPRHLLESRLPLIRASVAMIWSERDGLVGPGCSAVWFRGLKDSGAPVSALMLQDVGHSPQLECPLVAARATARMIDQMLGPSSEARLDSPSSRWTTLVPPLT